MKKQTLIILIGIALLIVTLVLLPYKDGSEGGGDFDRTQVGVSFFIVEDIVREVGGSAIEVVVSPPTGVDVHSFEPSARQIQELNRADIFFSYGAGVDPWASRISEDLAANGVSVAVITEQIELIKIEDSDNPAGVDPHAWLDPVLMAEMAATVRDALIAVDPDSASVYTENAAAFTKRLTQLDTDFTAGLSNCQLSDAIVAHDAFTYLGNRYSITMHAIAGLSPDAEPSAKHMSELATTAQELGAKYIFFESLTSPRLAEAIASEVGAETLILNPVEGLTKEEVAAGAGYIELMEKNLENLRLALDCR